MKHLSILVLLLLIGCIGSPALAQTEPMLEYISSPETIKPLNEQDKEGIAALPPSYRALLLALIKVGQCRAPFTVTTSSYANAKSYLERRDVRKAGEDLETVLKGFVSPEGMPLQFLEVFGCGKVSENQDFALSLWISEIRLALAEGRVGNALDRLELALKFYEALAMHSVELFSGAYSIDDAFLILFANSLEQFTPKDCNRLISIATRWETLENAGQIGFERNLNYDLLQLESTVDNTGRLIGESYRENKALMSELDKSKSVRFAMPAPVRLTRAAFVRRAEMAKLIRSRYKSTFQQCLSPFAHQKETLPLSEDLSEFFTMTGLSDRDQEDLKNIARYRTVAVRLLATHAAIRKFRWEHDRLPKTLVELGKNPLFIDPGTENDAPFLYRRNREGYTLQSLSLLGTDEKNRDKIVPFDLLLEEMPDFFSEEEKIPQSKEVEPETVIVIENAEGQKKSEP